ncbi:UNKNOWN [Stylonychia lemnae]|uniref:Uncharacterized protein n=1 Tax=Stylonychia lemnae TaxID=5949 RepID=A0A078B0D8_STYLE|nr:UNKNOWN [Stylonychia lemnae]|eukprot:CDW86558.1 UNKNOWN [Stylonychia lemnae]
MSSEVDSFLQQMRENTQELSALEELGLYMNKVNDIHSVESNKVHDELKSKTIQKMELEFYKDTLGFELEPIQETDGLEYKISINGQVLVEKMKLIQLNRERQSIDTLKMIQEKNPSKKLQGYRSKFLDIITSNYDVQRTSDDI